MMEIQAVIKKLIQEGLVASGGKVPEVDIELEHPADLQHGDYSCNIAMRLAKQLAQNPKKLAEEIVGNLPTNKYVSKVEIAGPGFINFYLAQVFFEESLAGALEQQSKWGTVATRKDKKVLIEHSSPNLFKPFHIGHLVNNTYGESLVRITRAAGAEVIPLSYPSDVSPGIAKAVWGILDAGIEDSFTIEQVGDAYVHGTNAYKEGGK